jgi:hypothetical protein
VDMIEGEVEKEGIACGSAALDEAVGCGCVACREGVKARGLGDDGGVGEERNWSRLVRLRGCRVARGWLPILGWWAVAQVPIAKAHVLWMGESEESKSEQVRQCSLWI